MTGQSNNKWRNVISQPVTSCLTNHSELCMSRLLNNQSSRISIYRLQWRPSFGFESSVSSTLMTSDDPVTAMMFVGGYDGVTSLGIPIQRQSLIGCVRRVRVDDVRIQLEKHRRVSPDDDVISFCRSP